MPTLTEIAYSTSFLRTSTTSSLSSLASSGTWFAASMWRIVWSKSKAAMGLPAAWGGWGVAHCYVVYRDGRRLAISKQDIFGRA